jgi:hypothetical protein
MYARHVTVHGSPEKVGEAVRSVRDHVLPVLKDCDGFKGQLLLVDRAKGEAIGISLWDTEANMNASEDKVAGARHAGARQQTADQVGASALPRCVSTNLRSSSGNSRSLRARRASWPRPTRDVVVYAMACVVFPVGRSTPGVSAAVLHGIKAIGDEVPKRRCPSSRRTWSTSSRPGDAPDRPCDR